MTVQNHPTSITIGDASEIPNNSRAFYTIDGENIAILNVNERLYAIRNSCPHMGGPLGEGKILRKPSKAEPFVSSFREFAPDTGVIEKPVSAADENALPTISCPLHGWEFDLAEGTPVFPAKRAMKTYAVWVEDGLIKLDLTIDAGAASIDASGRTHNREDESHTVV